MTTPANAQARMSPGLAVGIFAADLTSIKVTLASFFMIAIGVKPGCVNDLARVIYIEHGGTRHEVNVPNGLSVMDGAKRFTIPGIDGDCGGACACATCHVYVEDGWFARLPKMDRLERDMLDFAFEVEANSRLACQIKIKDDTDGLVIRCPARQY